MSSSWITSPECSNSTTKSSVLIPWLKFVLFSPCPQRVVLACIDMFFLVTALLFGVRTLSLRFFKDRSSSTSSIDYKPLLESDDRKSPAQVIDLWFYPSLIATVILALCYTVLSCFLVISIHSSSSSSSSWELVKAISRIAQAVAFVTSFVLISWVKKSEVVVFPLHLRLYWIANFVMATLFATSAIIRFIFYNGGDFDFDIRTDDIFSLVILPMSAFLFIAAIRGSSQISCFMRGPPKLGVHINVCDYGTASWFSKGTWLWMNPLLSKGYKSPLTMEQIPSLPSDYQAERMHLLFEKNWPEPGENSKNPVRTTLIRCFWKEIVLTGFLSVIKLAVMYIGPIMIQRFVNFTSKKQSSLYEGYYLVTALLLAKILEVLSSHHFNFQSRKVGMLIRSSLITSLYKKGLKLSCSSRQSHGAGQIVNYMAVDCQQLSDMMLQLHPLWLMPFQVGVALALLYRYMGASVLAAFVGVVAVMLFTMWMTSWNNRFMYNLMRDRDLRMKATIEMLNNMRVIKFQAWEDHFSKRIQSFRESEYGWLTKFIYSISGNQVLLTTSPIVIAALTFTVAVASGIFLDAGIVFTAVTLLRILQEPIQTFPQALVSITQATISLERLDRYLTSSELDNGSVERVEACDGEIAVEIKNGTFSWVNESGDEVLKNLNLEIKTGELAAIIGSVGSGKSSLLASVLGELHKVSGTVRVRGTTAYVSQTSWIQNASIQENILFGSPMNTELYKKVVRSCCLEKDLETMEHGDQTEIGERGINLSGGQKQRIQLARAVYQDCDVYLLDDVFSAVDAQTGSEIFKECVRGVLKDKTVLLVTHQVDFLHHADLIMVMRDGEIVQSGNYEELLESGMDFGALVAAHENSMDLLETSATMSSDSPLHVPKSLPSSSNPGECNDNDRSKPDNGGPKLIEDEEREIGQVNVQVYKQYSTEAYGWLGVAVVILIFILNQGSIMSSDYWLAYGISRDRSFSRSLFINIYWIITVVSCIILLIRIFLVALMGLKTAQSFFNQILHSIVHAPMSFFDTTPSGRILTRVSNDQTNVDSVIPMVLGMTVLMYFQALSIIFVTCQNAWPTVFLMIPLVWLSFWYRGYYLTSSRELTRLDSITKAPIIHHFSETITGVVTIRSFRKQDQFIHGNIDRVNANLRMDFYNNGSNEWLGFRLELMGSFVLCIATMFMIFLPNTIISPEHVGLSLSYGLALNVMIFWAIYMNCTVENKMVSVERIKQFISVSSEAAWNIEESLPCSNWPSHGCIEIEDLQVRYRPTTPLVLKGITLSIHGEEKIGVVGRTGSGKSTLVQVFFRMVEPSRGKIVIDGVDIRKLGLHDLRSRFGIIPQDPVLFQGTVRSNIDPIGLYSDEEIWKSLERCQLKDAVAAKPEKLYASVDDSGENWSVGQRQLLCLGRVMLKQSKILFMDEATASVDSQTDSIIQKIIREDFCECTVITVAHRIPTVIDTDRVLVIDDGWAKEFDKPANLLERPSLFGALVQEYATRSLGL